jgi:hypothetical protein
MFTATCLCFFTACSIDQSPGTANQIIPIPTQITVGALAGSVALLDKNGNPLTTVAAGVPVQLCVTLTSAPAGDSTFEITQENGVNLPSVPTFTLGQSPCIAVTYSLVTSSRNDNVTVVALNSNGSSAGSVSVSTVNFSVTAAIANTLSCLAVMPSTKVYIQTAVSTPVALTIDCGINNGLVSISSIPSQFQVTANGAPSVGTDGKLHVTGTLASAGTQTLSFGVTQTKTQLSTSVPATVTVTSVGAFSCTLNQATNPLVLTGSATPTEVYTVSFLNRFPQTMTATTAGGFPNTVNFIPAGAYSDLSQNSTFTFAGTFTSVGSFKISISAPDPIFAGLSTSCTTAQPTLVSAPVVNHPQITCGVSMNLNSVTIPVDANNNVLGQSGTIAYTVQLNEAGSIGNISGPAGAQITSPVASSTSSNTTFTFNASFRNFGKQSLIIPVTDLAHATSASCDPSITVVPVIQWAPLTCTVKPNLTAVTVQLDSKNNVIARTQGISFTVNTNRAGGNWVGVSGTGDLATAGLATSANGFTFNGSFYAGPGNYGATVSLADSKIAGAPVTQCTSPSVSVTGRAAIACAITTDLTTLPIAVNSNNQVIAASNSTGVTIYTSYVSNVPAIGGTGGLSTTVAPFALDNSGQHFRTTVNFGAVGSQIISATVVEPNGASSGTCSTQIQINAFGPSARISGGGTLGANQNLCSPNFSLTCWNSILSTDGQYHLDMQNDGNLVLYHSVDGLPVWASNTMGTGAAYATIDPVSGYLVLKDVNGNLKWWSGGGQFANTVLSVQTDANLVLYQGGSARWASANNGWWRNQNLWYKNGVMYCTGTSRNPAAAGINNCIQYTPIGWTMLLDADTYVIENGVQVILNKPMTLSTNGGWGNTTPCYNVPVSANPDAGTQWTGVPCAQLIADNNAHYPWGGFFIMGKPNGSVTNDSQGYPIPNFSMVSNVAVDHVNLNGNYIQRYQTSITNGVFQQLSEFVNATAANCTSCSFKNSATQFSLGGGFLMAYDTDNFIADHNSYYWHGNLKETRGGVLTPRHAGCADVQGQNSQFTNNFIRHCADEAVLITGAANGLVYNNVFYAHDEDFSSTELRVQTDGTQAGLRIIYNSIDCSDGECSVGITVGSNQFTGALPTPAGYLLSGTGASGVLVQSNLIIGANIGIMVGFRPVAGNAVYISGNVISSNNVGQEFQPMACKQWYGTRPDYVCCKPEWYNVPMPNWAAPYTNDTMGWGGNKVIGTPIMIDPSDWLQVFKDYNGTLFTSGNDAYSASWYGAGGGDDDSRSCF